MPVANGDQALIGKGGVGLDQAQALTPGDSPFHEGERAVQRRSGVERVAAQVARNILGHVPVEFGELLTRQAFVVAASQDERGRVWVSLLVGGVGFARALDEQRILLGAPPACGDPLARALALPEPRIGILAIEFNTRLRIRLNGVARRTPDGILVSVEEASGNCPKLIQRRLPTEPLATRLLEPATKAWRSMLDSQRWCTAPTRSSLPAPIPHGGPTPRIAAAAPVR